MSKPITVADLVKYVEENRKGNGFKDWTFSTLISRFNDGIDEQTLYYSLNHNDMINGVVLGTLSADKKSIFVDGVLTTAKGILKQFVRQVNKIYPNVTLCAHRRGVLVNYNTPKLKQKILAYGRT